MAGLAKGCRPFWFGLFGAALALKPLDETKPCNGDPALCHLRVDQVSWAGSHNADSVNMHLGFFPAKCVADNHAYESARELKDGLRYLDIDTCLVGDEIQLCHGPAMGDMLKPQFATLKNFLDENKREVLVISFINAEPGKDKHVAALLRTIDETLGSLVYSPDLEGAACPGIFMRSEKQSKWWPTLSELIEKNTRVIILWGRRMYLRIHSGQKAEKFANTHLRMEMIVAQTYDGDYSTMKAPALAEKLINFCPKTKDDTKVWKPIHDNNGESYNTSLVLADVYLTATPKRPSLSVCINDLAADVNLIFFDEGKDLEKNPLLLMQQNCWKTGKHVWIVSGDYVEYYPEHLQTIARALNERNFAKYAWVGGKLKLTSENTAISESDQKKLIKKLAGLKDTSRISIERSTMADTKTARRLAKGSGGSGDVEFSLSAAEDSSGEIMNIDALEAMREAAKTNAGVDKVMSTCRDPGIPAHATRTPSEIAEFFDEGMELTFKCNEEKPIPHGDVKRVCDKNGLFSGVQPRCRGQYTAVDHRTPFWQEVLVAIGIALLVLCCCGGCIFGIYKCIKKLGGKKGDYARVEENTS